MQLRKNNLKYMSKINIFFSFLLFTINFSLFAQSEKKKVDGVAAVAR